LFRFLLRLRRVQMDLERVWVAQKQWPRHPSAAAAAAKAKAASSLPAEDKTAVRLACLLRLEMSFFADGLLHYIQVPTPHTHSFTGASRAPTHALLSYRAVRAV
jgi:hypothetical protein